MLTWHAQGPGSDPQYCQTIDERKKKYKQPKCPSTDEWIKKNKEYPYNVILFSNKKELSIDLCYTL
jgi:hypothetical protein